MEETTALVVRRIEEIERRDEAQILAAMAGELITEYTYSFKDSRGRHQRNLSWAGIREMAQFRGNILVDEPIIEEKDDHWRIVIKATDILRNVSIWGGTHQPKIMRVKDTQTGEVYEEPDRFAFEKALSKAQRNAIKNLMPVTVIQEMIKRLVGDKRAPPAHRRQQAVEVIAEEEPPPSEVKEEEPLAEKVIGRDVSLFSQREEAISEITRFFKRKGWHQTTCEGWLLKVTGYSTPEECPDELLEKALRNIEAQMRLT